jgi:hypothetical protein
MIFKYLFNYTAVGCMPVNLAAKGSRWKAKRLFRGQIYIFGYGHIFGKEVNIGGLAEVAHLYTK